MRDCKRPPFPKRGVGGVLTASASALCPSKSIVDKFVHAAYTPEK